MNTDETVCGYTNQETFIILMDITNNRGSDFAEEWIRCASTGLAISRTRLELSDDLKNWYEINAECVLPNNLAYSLSMAALGLVNWLEIADDLAEKARERGFSK